MKQTLLKTALIVTIGTAASLGLAASDRPAAAPGADTGSRSVGTTIDDATITAKVKTALISDEVTKAGKIDVDTSRAAVTLKGTVGSKAEADRAMQIARSTEGVTAVRSELKIVN